jgi:methyl-accepting chemotaxis protein
MKLSVRIPILMGIVIVITAASIIIASELIAFKEMTQSMNAELSVSAVSNSGLIKSQLDAQLTQTWELANRATTRSMDWEATTRPSLMRDVSRIGALDIEVVFPNGTAYSVTNNTSAFLGDRDYVRIASSGSNDVSDVLINPATGNAEVMFASPIFENGLDGFVSGALVARKSGDVLSNITAKVTSRYESGYAFLVNKQGVIVAHPDQNMVMNQFNPMIEAGNDLSLQSLASMLSRTLTLPNGMDSYNYMNEDRICGFSEVPGYSLTLYVVIEKNDFQSSMIQMFFVILLIGIICTIIGIFIAVIISRFIAKPVISISSTLKDISEGEGDLTHRIDIHSKDEIGSLAQHFNLTIDKIRLLVSTIKHKVNALTNTGFELSVNMNKTSEAVDQISSKFENIKSLIAIQEEKASKADNAVGEINTSINHLYTLVEAQSESVDTSSSAVEEMTANIRSVTNTLLNNSKNFQDLSNAAETGKAGLQAVAEKIIEITKLSEGLLEINAVMNNIASQTNLLSMNAAIEAAHAGNSGKGFSVVADEIRKLAESSGAQSKTTSVMLKTIKDSIENITKFSDEVIARFEAIDSGVKIVTEQNQNIQHSMEEQEAGGAQILESVNRLKDITLSVKDGTEKMSEAGRRVIKETGEFIAVSDQVVDGMNDIIGGTMSQIKAAVENVNEMSKENNANFEDLKNETGKFKISTGGENNEVLVIDDDEIHLAIIKEMLENDYDITLLSSGEEALKLFYQGYSPNLILLDIMMPGMDGWDTLNRIKAISELHQVPIVFVSASDDPADISRAKELGAVDFIGKPVEKERLLEKIKSYIKAEEN